MKLNKDLFIGIDANAIVHRAFHAYPPTLTTTDGVGVNAVYGFTVMLLQMFKQFEPKYVVCAFDTAAPTFRHTMFTDYKAQRKPVDNSLVVQFPIVEQVLSSMNIPVIKREGYEADDILGTVSDWVEHGKWKDYDFDMYLLTGDRDFLQLIGERVKVCIPQGSFSNLSVFDRDSAFEKYGYYPEQVVEYKALVGDASDNIPGIKGIGDKGALGMLNKYKTLRGIYEHAEELPERQQKLLREGLEQAEFSKELATIKRDVDLDLKLESCVLSDFNEDEVVAIFKKLEFRSLLSKLPKSNNQKIKGGQMGMFEPKGVENTEIKSFDVKNLQIFAYISKEESESEPFCIDIKVDKEGRLSTQIIKSFTKDGECETWFYNFEEYVGNLVDRKLCTYNFYDIKLLAHTLSSGKKSYNLSALAFDYTARTLSEKMGKGDVDRIAEVLIGIVEEIKELMQATKVSEYVQKWLKFLVSEFKIEGLTNFEVVNRCLDIPLCVVISAMEGRGILIDPARLKKLDEEVDFEINKVVDSIFLEIGHEFNINSPKQLSDVLYRELGLPNQAGGSTREEVLEALKGMHSVIDFVLRYREIAKLSGTYIKPFLGMRHTPEGIQVNTDFKLTGSSSGRFASVNPNMQNIPARGEWASKIRSVFVPRKGFVFIGADYSQIEFRIMADISQDPVLVKDFNEGKDIHRTTASRILDKNEGEVTSEERNLGKTVNFAILFGQSPYGLSRLANISTTLAKQYIEEYFKEYAGVAKYIENAKELAMKYGYAQSMFGRTRYISGLSSKNRNIVSSAIREAVNMPIQGGEADIMRLAMLKIYNLIEEKYRDDAFMLLQIHDEIIFEVKEKVSEQFMKDIKEIMVNIVKLSIPLEVNISKGEDMSKLK